MQGLISVGLAQVVASGEVLGINIEPSQIEAPALLGIVNLIFPCFAKPERILTEIFAKLLGLLFSHFIPCLLPQIMLYFSKATQDIPLSELVVPARRGLSPILIPAGATSKKEVSQVSQCLKC